MEHVRLPEDVSAGRLGEVAGRRVDDDGMTGGLMVSRRSGMWAATMALVVMAAGCGSKTINQVAYELGFKYPQHFSRLFKQRVGYTPNEYRMQN